MKSCLYLPSNISTQWYHGTPYIGRSSAAQRLTQAEPRSQHGSCQEQPSNLDLDDAHVVDERLLDSPSDESETSREHQTSDSERESPQSSMSELTGSTLIQTQPSTMSSTLEHIVSKSTSLIQPYPEHDVGPRSQYAYPPIRHQSKLTKTVRRQNDQELEAQTNFSKHRSCQEQPSNFYLETPDDADVVDERLLDSLSNESETFRQHQTSDSGSPKSSRSELTENPLIQTQPSTMSSTLEHTVSKSTSPIQPYPEHDVGPRSQYAHPPIRHQSKLTRNERRQNYYEAQAGFSHNDLVASYSIDKTFFCKKKWMLSSCFLVSVSQYYTCRGNFSFTLNCMPKLLPMFHWPKQPIGVNQWNIEAELGL